jgi:hypothetical protein
MVILLHGLENHFRHKPVDFVICSSASFRTPPTAATAYVNSCSFVQGKIAGHPAA